MQILEDLNKPFRMRSKYGYKIRILTRTAFQLLSFWGVTFIAFIIDSSSLIIYAVVLKNISSMQKIVRLHLYSYRMPMDANTNILPLNKLTI